MHLLLFDFSGRRLAGEELRLSRHESRFLTLWREFSLAAARHWGSLQVRYTGQPHDLGVQLEVMDRRKGTALDVRSWETEDFSSSRLLGLAGAGTASTSNLLLINTTSQPRAIPASGRRNPQARAIPKPAAFSPTRACGFPLNLSWPQAIKTIYWLFRLTLMVNREIL